MLGHRLYLQALSCSLKNNLFYKWNGFKTLLNLSLIMLFVVLLLQENVLHNKIACNCIFPLFNTQLIYQSSMFSDKNWSIFFLKIQWVFGIYTGIQVYIFVYKYIHIYIYIYIYICIYYSFFCCHIYKLLNG